MLNQISQIEERKKDTQSVIGKNRHKSAQTDKDWAPETERTRVEVRNEK